MGVTRSLFGLHKQGHSFEISFELKAHRDQDHQLKFIGTITRIEPTDEVVRVIADKNGEILMVSGFIQKVFGYQAADLIGKNVTTLMPETNAVSHHTHMSSYIETGEGKVIGKKGGRNLMGKGKGGKLFPIILTLEKMQLQNEIFFVAGLWDSSNLMGTVFINGYGQITNVDEKFCLMYGYKRQDVLKQNIKIIMPPQYAGNSYICLY